ncbi:D-glycero-alpha-D-manno-heptose-1,7-bisphosphate 7-phosphatase [Anaeromicrobium sediminis]|uniref:D,D-heptose 1,7-bisphosphate phosphatase n=1 Tax=Anaeromicrobium sediminis TaxID=1478221 RepID=A0A267ML32_9FIRM|nr:HAD family hydrolase [Anaeromicrobium sediminis]PAB60246.1 hypothetical protein CCE28_04930 [Anaeromicrobium sediminis]
MKKAVFLDRDGVIIEDNGYIEDIEKVDIYPYTFEALKKLQEEYLLFIVTNQSGIGRGLITEEGVKKVNDYILDKLSENGISIEALYCCPHRTEDGCDCKKPKPYFMNKAIKEWNIDINNSFMIGDHASDIEFASNVGATGLYVLTGHGRKHLKGLDSTVQIYESLVEAVDHIMSERHIEHVSSN